MEPVGWKHQKKIGIAFISFQLMVTNHFFLPFWEKVENNLLMNTPDSICSHCVFNKYKTNPFLAGVPITDTKNYHYFIRQGKHQKCKGDGTTCESSTNCGLGCLLRAKNILK